MPFTSRGEDHGGGYPAGMAAGVAMVGMVGDGGGGSGYPGGGGRQRRRWWARRGGDHEEHVDGKKVLQRMCDETGGRLFEVKGKETVGAIYTEIGEELRSQYRLGYSPVAADGGEGYHQIEVTVPQETKDRVQTRDGYYAGK